MDSHKNIKNYDAELLFNTLTPEEAELVLNFIRKLRPDFKDVENNVYRKRD